MQTIDVSATSGSSQYALPLEPLPSVLNDDGSVNPEVLAYVRKKVLRMTQEDMAAMLEVSLDTYKSWEKTKTHNRQPSGPSKSLLRIAVARPDIVRAVLGKKEETTHHGIEEMSMVAS